MPYEISQHFRQVMHDLYGAAGDEWLADLPRRLGDLAQRWEIEIQPPFALSYNYVAPARRADGSEAVLKVGYPGPELFSELGALAAFDGHGINRLLASDPAQGAMLLERLRPGIPLAELADDAAATRIAGQVMRQLWVPAPEKAEVFPTTTKWGLGFQRLRRTFDGGCGPFPQDLVSHAERLFADLLASSAPAVLLHGDLHHWNILSAERAPWLALDPKGVLGEPCYEIGALMRNRWPENASAIELQRQVDRRLGILHEVLGFERQRMLAWTMAQAVLSAWWSYEDHRRVEQPMLDFAHAVAEMVSV